MRHDRPVIVIGAGIAGLAAAAKLGAAGIPLLMLEARDRIGGRIFTHHVSDFDAPIELGAEFIHGRPPEIWEALRQSGAEISEVDGENWCVENRVLRPCEFFSEVDSILKEMDESSPDESFLHFLERKFPNQNRDPKLQEAKRRTLAYVSGFNAADPAVVGVHWLVQELRAEEKIDGDRAFRSKNGYEDLLEAFHRHIAACDVTIRKQSVVESIHWKAGHVEVTGHDADGAFIFQSSQVLITLPLGVLKSPAHQPGAVRFTPPLPAEKVEAFDKLEMGEVIRVVLRFHQRFWEAISDGNHSLSDMNFLFSEDEWFPTWWTMMPNKAPVITGWAPFRSAQRLSGNTFEFVREQALLSLCRLLGVSLKNLESWLEGVYFHDWQTDPFSRGAYSYGGVGSDGTQQTLAAPLQNTLFFAGEATDTSGHNGTVHGAIASAYRASAEILKARGV